MKPKEFFDSDAMAHPENSILKEIIFFKIEFVLILLFGVGGLAVGFVLNNFLYAWGVSLIGMVGIYSIKHFLFLPKGKRVLYAYVRKDGVVKFWVGKLVTKLKLGDSEFDEVNIGNVKANREFYTGAPLVVIKDGVSRNVGLVDEDNVRDAMEVYMLIKNGFESGYQLGIKSVIDEIGGFSKNNKNLMILLIVVLVAVFGMLGFQYFTFDLLQSVVNSSRDTLVNVSQLLNMLG